jgi:hypothetical protein
VGPLVPDVGAWLASLLFLSLGFLFFFKGAASLAARGDHSGLVGMRVLGAVFVALGGLLFVALAGDFVLALKAPERRAAWWWWINFGGGMLGAGLFSVPALLTGPAMLMAYRKGTAAFITMGKVVQKGDLVLGFGFSIAGLLGLLLMYFVGRQMLRARGRARRQRA